MTLLFILVLMLRSWDVFAIDIEITRDPKITVGDRLDLECEVTSGFIDECIWYGPDGRTKFTTSRRGNARDAEVDIDGDFCILSIPRASSEDNGPWECVIYDRDETKGKFAFAQIRSQSGKLEVDLLPSQKEVVAQRGARVELICPTNAIFSDPKAAPLCNWLDPLGETHNLVGRRGEVFRNEQTGLRGTGDLSKGECGIMIDDVRARHYGIWSCKVLRQRQDGRPGSEVITADLLLTDEPRRSRSNTDDELQGFQDGDRDVKINVDFDLASKSSSQQNPTVYWIVQRQYIVKENRRYCPSNSRDCYTSSSRQQKQGNTYAIELSFDELIREDIREPIVLVRDGTDGNGRGQVQMDFVPKVAESLESVSGISRDNGCVVNGQYRAVGELVTLRDDCVEVTCESAGKVEIRAIRNCTPDTRNRDRDNTELDTDRDRDRETDRDRDRDRDTGRGADRNSFD
ncbi:hypothetical protein TCAL_12165 [Tigriopus californicus]|uniref:Ig-like domain-containing protein n=1 Tax=Tigriopus californicus TaxID=6832 RepID=A0A553NTX2_TIGCA|nr:uncharacterized protein LOC131882319 [Tigriopus californicus]TRY68872.1 hypothetical protein TCAL_12165 [Tigriopus californicus]|eukprot:TCALIF_12165-PA protein Name:"Protein of unknown function" AED:0.00 eAED:0.00 QI:173/1/0.5/1/1/0.5/2/0/458